MSLEDNVSLLPDVPLRHVLKYLDYLSILNLSEVSDRLCDFIDKEKLKLHLDRISIKVQPEKMVLSLSFNEERNRSRPISMEYQSEKTKWENRRNENKLDIGGESYLDDFHKDLNTILKHQKNVLQAFLFEIRNDYSRKKEMKLKRVCCQFYSELRDSLRTRNRYLQVVEFNARAIGHEPVIQVMKYFDPKILKTIRLSNFLLDRVDVFDIDAIINIDQFKQTQNFHLEQFRTSFSGPIQAFCHLTRFSISLNSITTDDLLVLKEAFQHLPNSKYFSINYKNFDDKDHLLELFGQPIEEEAYGIEGRIWTFPVPDSERTVSVIDVTTGNILFTCESPPIGIFDEYIFQKYFLDEEAYEMELDSDFGLDSDSDVESDSDLDMDADIRLDSDVNSGSDVELDDSEVELGSGVESDSDVESN